MAVYDVIHRVYVVLGGRVDEGSVAGHRFGGILCGGVLAYQYFMIYPQESRGMFDYWIKEKAEPD